MCKKVGLTVQFSVFDRLFENFLSVAQESADNKSANETEVNDLRNRIKSLQQMVINTDMDKTSTSQPTRKKPSRRMTWHPNQNRQTTQE